jgi:hypothetical protein
MSALHKLWLSSSILLFIFAGPCLSQERRNSIEDNALRIIGRLERDSYDYENARIAIARWYCQKGKYEEAAKQTTTLGLNERISLLSYIAKTASEKKDQPAATKLLNVAWSVVVETDDDIDSIWTEQLAEIAANNQNLDLAAKFAGRLDDGSLSKSRALLKIAGRYSDLQDKKESAAVVKLALSQIAEFSDDERRDEFDIKMTAARILAASADLDGANELAREVQGALVSEPNASVDDKTGLANLFGDLGELPRAIALVETIDGDERISAQMSLAQHCKVATIERSLLDRARDYLLNVSPQDYEGSIRLSNVIPVFLRAGRIDDAIELLRRFQDPYQLHSAAIKVAEALADKRKIDEAEAVLNIASNVARKIVSEKSEDIPNEASGSDALSKSQILKALIDAYIKLGRFGPAELAASAIDHPQYRSIAIAKIANGYSNNGDSSKARATLKNALAVSRSSKYYRHDFPKEYALFSLIESVTEFGLATEANDAMAQFLTLIKDDSSVDRLVGELFILGRLFESHGLSTSKKVDALFKQIEENQNGDN